MTSPEIRTGDPVDVGGLLAQEALIRLEEEILLSPKIMESGLDTILRRYVDHKTDTGVLLTPDTEVTLGDADEAYTAIICAGTNPSTTAGNDYHRKVIYRKSTATGETAEWIVFSGFPNTVVSDGSGRELESADDRKFVRSLLETMNTNYDQRVTALADEFDINPHLSEALDGAIAAAEAELASLRAQKERIEKREESVQVFTVSIMSAWEREGEKNIEEEVSADSLSGAIRKAADKFRATNGRSDIQARTFSVGISLGGNTVWTLPQEVVLPLFQSLSYWDKEAHDIETTKEFLPKLVK